jgi:protein-S-isoprenylcysteine O-methyltransferase Ste14
LWFPHVGSLFINITIFYYLGVSIAGTVIVLLSIILGIFASKDLKDSWRVGIISDQKTKLIQTGIYRYSRNPYFFSYFTMFSGFFLITPNILMLIKIVIAIFVFDRMIKREEVYLEKVHGGKYVAYKKKVGRYLNIFKRKESQ